MNKGAVNVVNGSKAVTGVGTAFLTSANPARVGQPMIIADIFYEIEKVVSDNSILLATNYRGATANNVAYSVVTTAEGSSTDLARRAAQVMGYYQGQLDVIQALLVGNGNVTATLPDGSTVILPSWSEKQTASKTLTSISELNSAADTIPFFSGKDTAAIATLTEFARRVMASPTAADIRALLQLGSAAIKNTGNADGEVITVGALGYGGVSVRPTYG
ncbi:MAG: hypothetical protein KA754_03025, partial [Corallincola sp.]|nr:hypothetical protein [Corallincola sp.]